MPSVDGDAFQKVSLNVDVYDKSLKGYTELHLLPLINQLTHIRVNCRQVKVHAVTLNGVSVPFTYEDPLLTLMEDRPLFSAEAFEARYLQLSALAAEGELTVHLPSTLKIEQSNSNTSFLAHRSNLRHHASSDDEDDGTRDRESSVARFKSLALRIDYSLVEPRAGVCFNETSVHTYSPYIATRTWLPCIDDNVEFCKWELELTMPVPLIAVASGELKQHVVNESTDTRMMLFSVNTPCIASSIGFAVGKFDDVHIRQQHVRYSVMGFGEKGKFLQETKSDAAEDEPMFTDHRHLKRKDSIHSHSESTMSKDNDDNTLSDSKGISHPLYRILEFLPGVMHEIESYLGAPYPYESLKVVFVNRLDYPVVVKAGLIFADADLLYDETVIDQVYVTRRWLAVGFAMQWFGHFIVSKHLADVWLIQGLAVFTAWQGLRVHLGNNEYRYQLRVDAERLANMDVDENPLYNGNSFSATDFSTEFVMTKSFLVLHMIERRLPVDTFRKVISTFLALARDTDPSFITLSTSAFLRHIKRVSGRDLRRFADRWIFSSGAPILRATHTFERKRNTIEFRVAQRCSDVSPGQSNDAAQLLFQDPITIRVHETDGTFDHVVQLDHASHDFEFPFHSKFKRTRFSRYRFFRGRRKHATTSDILPSGIAESDMPPDASNPNDASKATPGTDAALKMSPVNWIRIDPDMEWAASVRFEQESHMWCHQLLSDKDVSAQLDAVQALARSGTVEALPTLLKVIRNQRLFYRVRMEAMHALAAVHTEKDHIMHLRTHLRKIYCTEKNEEKNEEEEEKGEEQMEEDEEMMNVNERLILPPNDFTEKTQHYYCLRALLSALSHARTDNAVAPIETLQLLLNTSRLNDNTMNTYSDAYYLADLLVSFATCFVRKPFTSSMQASQGNTHEDLLHEMLAQVLADIQHYVKVDRYLSSYRHRITWGALKALTLLTQHGWIRAPVALYMDALSFDELDIRLLAFQGLLNAAVTPSDEVVPRDLLFSLMDYIEREESGAMRRESVRRLGLLLSEGAPGLTACIDVHFYERVCQMLRRTQERRAGSLLLYDDATQWLLVDVLAQLKGMLASTAFIKRMETQEAKWVGKGVSTSSSSVLPSNTQHSTTVSSTQSGLSGVLLQNASVNDYLHGEAYKSCKDLLQRLIQRPESWPFLQPVDRQVVPQYYEIIRQPMDFGTLRQQLESRHIYRSVEEFEADLRRIFSNCFTFNAPMSLIYELGQRLFRRFERWHHWSRRERDQDEAAHGPPMFAHLLNKLMSHRDSWPFLMAVDAQAAPGYYEIIQRPMHFFGIQDQLEAGHYAPNKEAELITDIRQIFRNCFTYNTETSEIYQQGKRLESYFKNLLTRLKKADIEDTTAIVSSSSATTTQSSSSFFPQNTTTETIASSHEPYVDIQSTPTTLTMTAPERKMTAGQREGRKMTAEEHDVATRLLSLLSNHKDSVPFRMPVDAVALGVPTYYTVIRSPMDLSTMAEKLSRGVYADLEDFQEDVQLIINNCLFFNAPDTAVCGCARRLRSYFERQRQELRKPPKGTAEHPRSAQLRQLLTNLAKAESAYPFMEPVNAEAVGALDYHEVIRTPMDFGTVRRQLKEHRYANDEAFERDARLVFSNCFQYNPPGTPVYNMGKELEAVFNRLWRDYLAGEMSPSPATPRVKLEHEEMQEEEVVPKVAPPKLKLKLSFK